jgi:protein-tyrosine phosphatase
MLDTSEDFAALWVGEGLLLCDLPLRRDHLVQLHDAGVRVVLNLCDPEDERLDRREGLDAAFDELGLEERHRPLSDALRPTSEDFDECVAIAARELESGRPVAIHCRDGREHAPLVAAAIRALRADEQPREALAEIARISPLAAPLSGQVDALEAWARDRR